MKLYNVNPTKKKFEWGEMDCIELGEHGRGRQLTIVPFHAPVPPTEGSNYEISATKNGNAKIVIGSSLSKGWIAMIGTGSTYTRGTTGCIYVHPEDTNKVKVLASGYGAFGIAGRIGNWNDYLVVVSAFPTRILVRPSGGANKRPRYWLVFLDNKVERVGLPESDMYPVPLPFMKEGSEEERQKAGMAAL